MLTNRLQVGIDFSQKQQLFAAMFDTDMDEINLAARSRVAEMQQLVASLLGEEVRSGR